MNSSLACFLALLSLTYQVNGVSISIKFDIEEPQPINVDAVEIVDESVPTTEIVNADYEELPPIHDEVEELVPPPFIVLLNSTTESMSLDKKYSNVSVKMILS